MKKIMAIIIAISLIVSCFGTMTASAIIAPEDAVTSFNIEDYTWEDIMTMSNSDFRELLMNFEREYDPFGTYETQPITSIYEVDVETGTVSPQWTSGSIGLDGTYTDNGSHELITARACGVLLDDKGFWGTNESASILIALTICLASIEPDRDPILGALDLFKGHFYDPDTGKNWAGGKTNTAKKNAQKYFNEAKEEYELNGISEDFIMSVGKMVHYVQDACQPHHAANITALENGNVHTKFEEFADENLESYLAELTTVLDSSYAEALTLTVEEKVHNCAVVAKNYSVYVDDVDDQSEWSRIAGYTTRNSARATAVILYKLSIELGMPLTK